MKFKSVFIVPFVLLGLASCDLGGDELLDLELKSQNNISEIEVSQNLVMIPYLKGKTSSPALYSWHVDNEDVGTINSKGVFTADNVGTASISATYKKDITIKAYFDVSVIGKIIVPTSIEIQSITSSFEVELGETLGLLINVQPVDANKNVSWTSLNTNILTVDNKGVVTPVAAGSTSVIATSIYDNNITDSVTIMVLPEHHGEITIISSKNYFETGESETFSATVTGNLKVSNVRYRSSNESIATINNTTGEFKAIAKGDVTITAYYSEDETIKATKEIQVVNEVVFPTSATIYTDSGLLDVVQRKTLQLRVNLAPEGCVNDLVWSSLYADRATVDQNGLVTGLQIGAVSIQVATASTNKILDTIVLMVIYDIQDGTITIDESKTSFYVEDTYTFTSTVSKELESEKVRYDSSDITVATIEPITGLFTALSIGTTNIKAYYLDDSTITSKVLKITVAAKPLPPESVTVSTANGEAHEVRENSSLSLKAVVLPSGASQEVTWQSSSPTNATVSSSGIVKGIKTGSVIITATCVANESIKNTIAITVLTDYSTESITLVTPSKTSIEVDDTLSFSATVTSKLQLSNVRFESSTPSVASIDATTGLLTAISIGTTKVTAYYSEVTSIVSSPITITVKAKTIAPTSITLSSSAGTSLEAGDTTQITISAILPTGASQSVTWSSTNTSVATVNQSGKVTTTQTGGSVIIKATSTVNTSVVGQISLTVSAPVGYYRVTSYGNYNMQKLNTAAGMSTLNATGDSKILVVPVQFSGASGDSAWNTSRLNTLEKGFFGESSETSWESVSSFYNKSSYGELNITGEVTSVLTLGKTKSAFETEASSNNYDDVEYPMYAAGYFYNNISKVGLTNADLKRYDTDSDGYIDAIYFVYANDYNYEQYWAWVWWMGGEAGGGYTASTFAASTSKPSINTHMWASYHFFEDGYGTSGIDAHTLIHESGHILGLDDYYDYDNNGCPAGAIDMMDNNIIDHNAYSKMALEWVKPYYVDGTASTATINIGSFAETGEYILINNGWNKHTLDEYILVELYTPTNLNYKDSQSAYRNGLQGFTVPGIRIWHVDARAGVWNSSTYSDTPAANGSNIIKASNTISRSYAASDSYKLLHLMQAGGVNTLSTDSNAYAENADLFKAGSSFAASSVFFPNGTKFNDSSTVGYRIYIDTVSSSNAQIRIVKI